MSSYEYRHYPYRRPPELDGKGRRRPVVDRRRRHGRADAGARARGARRAVGRARRGRHGQHRQPLDLPGQAQPRSLGPLRHRPAHGRQGHHLGAGRGLSRRPGDLPLQPAARARPQVPGLREPAAVLRRGISLRALPGRARDRDALPQQGRRRRRRTPTTSRSRSRHRMAATRSRPSGWSPATACAAPCATCSGCRSRARSSTTSS